MTKLDDFDHILENNSVPLAIFDGILTQM